MGSTEDTNQPYSILEHHFPPSIHEYKKIRIEHGLGNNVQTLYAGLMLLSDILYALLKKWVLRFFLKQSTEFIVFKYSGSILYLQSRSIIFKTSFRAC